MPTHEHVQPHDMSRSYKRKDKPPVLAISQPPAWHSQFVPVDSYNDDGRDHDVLDGRDSDPRPLDAPKEHVEKLDAVLNADDIHPTTFSSRSTSSSSSLDPYYFGTSTSPDTLGFLPSLPADSGPLPTTPDAHTNAFSPMTPHRDPSSIDRAALHGLGELATPRWTRSERGRSRNKDATHEDEHHQRVENAEVSNRTQEEDERRATDSPWTIEAIDGETDDDEANPMPPPNKTLRARRSIAEESGGEEILYPRQPVYDPKPPPVPQTPAKAAAISAGVPPTAFVSPMKHARKRTSDEFELDHSGTLSLKHHRSPSGSYVEKPKEERSATRKHRSLVLGVGLPTSTLSSREKQRERRRESGAANNLAPIKVERHTRHTSTGSSSSSHGETRDSRRGLTSDFSHLPPSPSSSSIQYILRHVGSNGAIAPTSHSTAKESSSANVAHSLLRGTQESSSDLDAEALRRLDGLSGKSGTRVRSSVVSARPGSSSRPNTPVRGSTQWEGMATDKASSRRSSLHVRDSLPASKDKDQTPNANRVGLGLYGEGSESITNSGTNAGAGTVTSGDEVQSNGSTNDKSIGKKSTAARLSYTTKRGSASSTNYASTPTTSSRDSASLSTTTTATSVSAQSKHSSVKSKRNSASSDISISGEAAPLKDHHYHAHHAHAPNSASDQADGPEFVPPVPPLPKDLTPYRSPPPSAPVHTSTFDIEKELEHEVDDSKLSQGLSALARKSSFTSLTSGIVPAFVPNASYDSQGYSSSSSAAPVITKTPSKKWSFTNALGGGKKAAASPSSPGFGKKSSPIGSSPRGVAFPAIQHPQPQSQTTQVLRKLRRSESKDRVEMWSPVQPGAMTSATSLASQSSLSSAQALSPSINTPERQTSSRPGTASSAQHNHTYSYQQQAQGALAPVQVGGGPLSPSNSIRRSTSKRLTPSSIPFFRRSSSQSMQANISVVSSGNKTVSPTTSHGALSIQLPLPRDRASPIDSSLSTPASAHKKSSMLSLGSLLKSSSSKRNLHARAGESVDYRSDKESRRGTTTDKEDQGTSKNKKDDKDRSESRISMLMGRRRGKTMSSSEQKKPQPVSLPPMQISALPPATAQRLANMKPSSSTTSSTSSRSTSGTSRATSATASSLQRASDASLRSRGQHLPTIAGSPSVGTAGSNSTITKEMRGAMNPPASSSSNHDTITKETPTKIPRIHSRTSTLSSPALKTVRRQSLITSGGGNSSSNEPSPTPPAASINEFGVLDLGGDSTKSTPNTPATITATRQPAHASPSSNGSSRVARQSTTAVPSSSTSSVSGASSGIPRKGNRESLSFGLRKSSTSSVASAASSAMPNSETGHSSGHHHRFSALSPSKGLKLLSPKVSLARERISNSVSTSNIHQAIGTPSPNSRQSLSTPSPAPSTVDDDEVLGDEEMLQYIKRQQQKKLAHGATQEELDELLKFPEPLPPVQPSNPTAILKGSQRQYLCDYERQEILNYPSVYYLGATSEKKMAHQDRPTNNYGYDDDRGDYLVINHDHLAFRYEIIDTLGKGSFGQVLSCRDHCTGEMVAIKIIRNKKRFHHQALIEIKILDNLRKWDADEKHHVIKMTEHFYFRGHLCIAMELLSINLYELIKANGFVGFTTTLIRRFTSQMLMSLTLMRHHRIVHCDLKPENVLLRHPAKSAIKVIDFGSSCFEHEKIYTYIQSRFYRSPEVILGMNYHMAIDMWSLGCILAELKTGFPIFPGENEQEQLSCIMEVLGVPDKDFINRSSRKRLFFDSTGAPRPVVNSKGRRRRPGTKTLQQVLRSDDEHFIDFVAKCLIWDPERRLKPQSALKHPFIVSGKQQQRSKLPMTPSNSISNKSFTGLASSSRSKTLETPKKSQISAPTPLTARSSRTTGINPTTPSTSTSVHSIGSSRSYRSSQAQSGYHSSRTNGFTVR